MDLAGDGTVTAQSVEGEDDLVDVSMQDGVQSDIAPQQGAEKYVSTVQTSWSLGANWNKDPQSSSRILIGDVRSGSNLKYISMASSKICLT